MIKRKEKFSPFVKAAAVIMMFTLAWLTISLPFVYHSQQVCEEYSADASDNIPGSPEERSERGVNQLSEYLHDLGLDLHNGFDAAKAYQAHRCNIHLDIHPEFFSPPPEA